MLTPKQDKAKKLQNFNHKIFNFLHKITNFCVNFQPYSITQYVYSASLNTYVQHPICFSLPTEYEVCVLYECTFACVCWIRASYTELTKDKSPPWLPSGRETPLAEKCPTVRSSSWLPVQRMWTPSCLKPTWQSSSQTVCPTHALLCHAALMGDMSSFCPSKRCYTHTGVHTNTTNILVYTYIYVRTYVRMYM